MGTYYDRKTKRKRILTFGLVETILNTSLAPKIVLMTGRRVRLAPTIYRNLQPNSETVIITF